MRKGQLLSMLTTLSVLAIGVATGSPASAAAPERTPMEIPSPINFGAGEACSFPIRIDVLVNNEFVTVFSDESGNPTDLLITGRLVVQVTNVETGESVTLQISGPALATFEGDVATVRMLGVGLTLPPPGLFDVTGIFEFTIDAEGNVQVVRMVGTSQDICQVLAS